MSDDPEIEQIKQRKLREMLDAQQQKQQQRSHAAGGIVELQPDTFDGVVSSSTPTLVDFWASWCGPCKAMHHVFEELDAAYPGITFARVNVDACPQIAARFAIQSIPTFVMFHSGAVTERVMGAVGPQGIHAMCRKIS